MEITHILDELAYDLGELPRDAIEAAIAKREQITPFLLEVLKDAIERIDDVIEDDNYQGHLYAMYLLAQFRVQACYPMLLELFSFPGEIPHAIAGDIITEDLHRIFASVCGKEIAPLKRLIENPAINEYVRASCETCLVTLVGCGMISRNEVITYFQTLFAEKLEKRPSFVWDTLLANCCLLHAEELVFEIQKAFEEGLVDPKFISLQDVQKSLAEDKENRLFQLYQTSELIEDTVTEMEKWLTNQSFQ